ncbi:MAG: hypothetical protein WBF33_07175 [Candidatus Nitrosopolaris sp.]|jgi:hypothetical protein
MITIDEVRGWLKELEDALVSNDGIRARTCINEIKEWPDIIANGYDLQEGSRYGEIEN